MKCQEATENCMMSSTTVCTLFLIVLVWWRTMERAAHVARMEAFRNAYEILVGMSEGKRGLGTYECWCGIMLKWMLGKWDVGRGLDSCGRRQTNGGLFWTWLWNFVFYKMQGICCLRILPAAYGDCGPWTYLYLHKVWAIFDLYRNWIGHLQNYTSPQNSFSRFSSVSEPPHFVSFLIS
jgi:hypothetical protein